MASFALEIVNTRTAGTCQGLAAPRPAGAPLTEPVRSRKRFLIRGRRKQIEVSYNPGTVIGSGSFDGGRPAAMGNFHSALDKRKKRKLVVRCAFFNSPKKRKSAAQIFRGPRGN